MVSRRWLSCLVLAALAVAALLVTAEPASAQRERSRGGVGYSPGTGLHFGYGNPSYGDPYYRGGYYDRSYGRGYYPGYYGYGWNTPGYRWSEYNWSQPSYSWSNPSYYTEGTEGDYYGAGAGYAGESYGAPSGGAMDNRVVIGVRVPANAEVWFEDQKTSQTGMIRHFASPPLESDRKFTYHIRARWTEDGRQVEKDRKLEVHPGDQLFVNFMKPPSESMRNRQENTDRTGEDRSQSPTRTGTERRPQTSPQGDTSRPPDKP